MIDHNPDLGTDASTAPPHTCATQNNCQACAHMVARWNAEKAAAWERGYESGYDDREKMDHDRADVIRTENPYATSAVTPLPPPTDEEPSTP